MASYKEGVEVARDSLESGGALAAFEGFRDCSRRAMGEDVLGEGVREGREDDGGVAAKNGEVKSWLKAKRAGGDEKRKEDKEDLLAGQRDI